MRTALSWITAFETVPFATAAASVLPRYRVQRPQRRRQRTRLLSEALSSLNALAEAQAARPLAPRAPLKVQSIADPVAASMHSRIARRVAAGSEKPVGVPEGKEALKMLLKRPKTRRSLRSWILNFRSCLLRLRLS